MFKFAHLDGLVLRGYDFRRLFISRVDFRSRPEWRVMNVFQKKGLVSDSGGLQMNSTLPTAFLQNRSLSVSTTA